MNIAPCFLCKREAKTYSGISERSLDYARSRGELAFYKHGGKILFKVADLDRYMKRFRVDASACEGRAES